MIVWPRNCREPSCRKPWMSKIATRNTPKIGKFDWLMRERNWSLFVVVHAFFTLQLALISPLHAQISPGPISRAHASIGGPLQCLSCHKLAAGSAIYACLDCHKEIDARVSRRRGFHGSVVSVTSTSKDCIGCHSEHNGENFSLIHWGFSQKAFDHKRTGYTLEGKHAELRCQQCHKSEHVTEAERATIKMKDLNRTFLGLSRDCVSCHEDKHRGQLGKNCLQCHTLNDWKTASGFDHSKTKFPLSGSHTRLACEKCHKRQGGAEGNLKYIGLAFETCSSCHADPHKGAFKMDCASCHSNLTWKQLLPGTIPARFDHSKTKYPLTGKHAGVQCRDCHHGEAFGQPLAHDRCADCHSPDPHRGQFRARKDGGACESCHTVEGFKSSQFGVAEHAATAYPLEGKHANVPCAKCHPPLGAQTLYKVKHDLCTDCHKDIHEGQFAQTPYHNQCEHCHSVRGFTPSSFSLPRHTKTQFPLTGAHVAVPCTDCHQAKTPPGAGHAAPYHFAEMSCTGCHEDPHKGQFAERMNIAGPRGGAAGCEACHTTERWAEIERFDHSTTKFQLSGSHRAAPCMGCHKPPNLELTMRNVSFRSAPTPCEGCHEDIHAGQFVKGDLKPGCAECHITRKWKPSLFDHEKQTIFPLKGGHKDVACTACHKTKREVDGRAVLFFKSTPRDCAACHGPAVPK